MIRNYGIPHWVPGPTIPIFHIFEISGGNVLSQKAREIFMFNFIQVYVKVLLLQKYLRSKFRKKFFMAFFGIF